MKEHEDAMTAAIIAAGYNPATAPDIARIAHAAVAPLIAAREREACAEISFDEYLAASHDDEDPQNHDLVARFMSQGGADSANRIYAAIRARGGEG